MKAQTLLVGLGIIGALAYTSVGAQLLQHGPTIINPGTADAAIMTYVPAIHRTVPVQIEYLSLVNQPDIVVFEDGSITTRAAFERQRHAHALRTLKPTGCTFLPTEIEATTDR